MTPWLQDADCTLYHGDALDVLQGLPDESVNCVATSPPFYGLRDYGTGRWEGGESECDHRESSQSRTAASVASSGLEGGKSQIHRSHEFGPTCGKCGARRVDQQIGLEDTPEQWRDRLVSVFRELRRVLVPTGTLWIECGDSYNAGTSARRKASTDVSHGHWEQGGSMGDERISVANCKPKDLIGSPFLLAFGLRDDGWWWRSTNIWHKPNCLPESVTDRPVVQHSYVFQFSKRARYYHDAEAVREPAEWARWGDQTVVKEQQGKAGWIGPNSKEYLTQGRTTNGPRSTENRDQTPGFEQRLVSADGTKALRSVWTIPTEGYPEAHFATWPTKLAARILLMACPEQVCRECGKARERIVETTRPEKEVERLRNVGGRTDGFTRTRSSGGLPPVTIETVGFTDCGCLLTEGDYRAGHSARPGETAQAAPSVSKWRPGVVLDPFVGSGTTCLVARNHGRHSIGIDLNEDYLKLAAARLQQQSLLAQEPA